MRPAILVLALATILQSPAASQNGPPAISLSTQPARQVYSAGERFTVVATATDDSDAPDRLQYRWTVKNLETGVEQAAQSTNLRQVNTRGRAVGRYEYKCVVTDSAGLSGEASLMISIEDTGKPEVASLAFDDGTAVLHHVTPFWQEGVPAIRRGNWAMLLISVRNFVAGPHFLKVFVDGKAVTAGVPGSAWAVQHLGGTTTEQRVRLFVPPDTAVGRHKIEVAAITRATQDGPETETSRASFPMEPLVLFNPWRSTMPDVSVHAAKPLSNTRATFYTLGTQDAVMSGSGSKYVYDVTPQERATVTLAQEIVASMAATDRGDAARVAAAMAAHVRDKVPAGETPAALVLTSILRSIGIPARTMTIPPVAPGLVDQLGVQAWSALTTGNADDGWTVVDAAGGAATATDGFVTEPGFERSNALNRGVTANNAVQPSAGAPALPIAVALPARVNAGATFAVSARLVNSSNAPVQDASLRLVLPRQLQVVSGAGSGTKAVISPGGDLRVDAMVQAVAAGTFLAGAASQSSAGRGEEHAPVIVRQPMRLFVEGEPALGIKSGEPITVTAGVILDSAEPVTGVEARLEAIDGAPLSIVGDAHKRSDALAPDDLWTPSWQVLVTAPGTYRLPVRVKTAGIGESSGEILLIAGATDPDADMTDDFDANASLGYRSPKAIAGAVAVLVAILSGGVYYVRRRKRL